MPDDLTNSNSFFVDTNIFVYAEDAREPVKRATSYALLEHLSNANRLVISTQVINEFCSVILRGKHGKVAKRSDLSRMVSWMESAAQVVALTPEISHDAIRAFYTHSISWYDALIWAAAKSAGCTTIYTEDVPGVGEIEGVRYVNPFV